MEQDHIISEVRKNREKLSEQFDNNLDKLFEYFKKEEKKIQIKAQESSAEEEIRL